MAYAINHCEMKNGMKKAGMKTPDVQEAVMERVGQIVAGRIAGKKAGSPHPLSGVELMARVVADSVMEAGAAKLAGDFEFSLEDLKKHAASTHISSC